MFVFQNSSRGWEEGEPKFFSCRAEAMELNNYEKCARVKLCSVHDLREQSEQPLTSEVRTS